jgi:hypothetical protein
MRPIRSVDRRNLSHDHSLEAGHVTLLGGDLEVRVDDTV